MKQDMFFLEDEKDVFEDYELRRYPNPYKILIEIGGKLESLKLIRAISKGKEVFRARHIKSKKKFITSQDLGSPPSKNAIYPNRMSPSGISMFYGAFDQETCIAEIKDNNSIGFTIAKWKTVRDLNILDLTMFQREDTEYYYPDLPSIYDSTNRWKRSYYKFLLRFVKDFTKPIEKDGYEHIDYVPTQVFSEYLRRVFKTHNNKPLDGIIYYSSKNDGKCCVFFCGPEGCSLTERQEDKLLLELISNSIETIIVVSFIKYLALRIKNAILS